MDFLLYLYGGGVYIKKVSNKLDSKMWITFWKKAWKYGFFVLSLLCKLNERYEKI